MMLNKHLLLTILMGFFLTYCRSDEDKSNLPETSPAVTETQDQAKIEDELKAAQTAQEDAEQSLLEAQQAAEAALAQAQAALDTAETKRAEAEAASKKAEEEKRAAARQHADDLEKDQQATKDALAQARDTAENKRAEANTQVNTAQAKAQEAQADLEAANLELRQLRCEINSDNNLLGNIYTGDVFMSSDGVFTTTISYPNEIPQASRGDEIENFDQYCIIKGSLFILTLI